MKLCIHGVSPIENGLNVGRHSYSLFKMEILPSTTWEAPLLTKHESPVGKIDLSS